MERTAPIAGMKDYRELINQTVPLVTERVGKMDISLLSLLEQWLTHLLSTTK